MEAFQYDPRETTSFFSTGISFWLITNILVYLVITEAAMMFILTGIVLLLANLAYYFGQPRYPVVIPVEGTKLELTFGWCFYINLVAGKNLFFIIPRTQRWMTSADRQHLLAGTQPQRAV
jgi:hypothetical protein